MTARRRFWERDDLAPPSVRATEPVLGVTRVEAAPLAADVQVKVLEGPFAGRVFALGAGASVIGSEARCDVVLDEPSVSRRHAQAEPLARAVQLTDLGSVNGLNYLGQRVEKVLVPYGASVRLGRTRLCFEHGVRPPADAPSPPGLIGDSLPMRRLAAQLGALASSDVSVLFEGPSGSGKEMAARALHAMSPRATAPFVVFDAASAGGQLIEADLFGVEAGAFTGASPRAGLFAQALEGTLLIDSVHELSPALQPRLLRVLEAGTFRRVGGNRDERARCRVLATSQVELSEWVNQGLFRADLYFRLAAHVAVLPSLDERREDIGALADHFAAALDRPLPPAARDELRRRSYPGNVRQLKNEVQRAVEGLMTPEPGEGDATGYNALRDDAVRAFEVRYLAALLERHDGNVSAAAVEAGLSRSQFYRVLRRHPALMARARG